MMKVGIIGCGKIAEKHVQAYKNLDGVEVVVADIDAKQCSSMSDQMKVPSANNIEDLFKDPSLDAVDICVPTPFHYKYIVQALDAGKHVFCEKPMCLNLEEAHDIQKRAEVAQKTVMVGYLYRHHSAFQFVKKILDDGVIGKPHFAIFRLGGRGSHMAWKHKKGEGGGASLEMLVHMLDLVVWYMNDISHARLLAEDVILKNRSISGEEVGASAEDLILLEINSNEAKIFCESDLVSPGYMNYVEIHGDNGSVFTSILHYMPTVVFCKEARGVYNVGNNIYNFPAENLFEKELSEFVQAAKNDQPNLKSIEDSVVLFEAMKLLK